MKINRKPYRLGTGTRALVGNLLMRTDGTVLAGYRVGPRRWDYLPNETRASEIASAADVYAALSGRLFHERVTTRPYPVANWAARLDARTPRPLPGVGEETWNRHLARQQARIAASGMDEKVVYRYVGVGMVPPRLDLKAAVAAESPAVADLLASERLVADAVKAWPAVRMSESEQAWLRVRSLAPGLLPPAVADVGDGWDEQSLPALADHVRWSEEPFGRTVSVRAVVDGVMHERAVQVLSVARMSDLNYPECGLEPWQTYAERAVDGRGVPFGVDFSIVGELRTGEQMKSGAEMDLRKAIWLERDFREHNEPPPAGIEKGIAVAKSTRDAVHEGRAVEAGRFVGTINMVVTGEPLMRGGRQIASAAEVCEDRAAALQRLFAGNDLRMELAAAQPQSLKLAEVTPGEAMERFGYQRQVRYDYLAAGVPSADTQVGDRSGPYMGTSRAAAARAFMHDPHYATEGRGARGRGNNFWLIPADLGGGKSMLAGTIAYNGARRSARVVISDPSGPLAALTQLPELKEHSLSIDLLKGPRGVLSPPSLIREPMRADFDSPGEWAEAIDQAQGERRRLVADIARRCLESDLYASPGTVAVLRDAARKVTWYEWFTMWDLVAQLRTLNDPHAHAVADALTDASSTPLLSLLFPVRGQAAEPVRVYDARLTVISTPGVRRAPDGVPREDWNDAELAADVILRLVSLFTDRLIYGKPRDERCIAIFDEAENLTDFGPGRGFLSRLGRDHSKWNIAVYMLVKSIDPQMLSGELRNFLAGAFVGRMSNVSSAEAMLDVLNVRDRRYARTLMGLSRVVPGEFVHLDADGRVGGVRIDLDYLPHLKAALLTNPEPDGAQAWSAQ